MADDDIEVIVDSLAGPGPVIPPDVAAERARPGDLDVFSAVSPQTQCTQSGGHAGEHFCSRRDKHGGVHIEGDGRFVVAVWQP